MSVRPVDTQTAITRTQDAARHRHQQEIEPAVQQHLFGQALRRHLERAESQVARPPEARQPGVEARREGRARSQADREGRGGRRGQPDSRTGRPVPPAEPHKGTRLDLKL